MMELRICCDTLIDLIDYKTLNDINYNICNYTYTNGELNGNIKVYGNYNTNKDSNESFEKLVPFTLVFKSENYEIKEIKIDNFKNFDVVNNGLECSFEVYVNYNIIDEELDESKNNDIINEDINNIESIEEDTLDVALPINDFNKEDNISDLLTKETKEDNVSINDTIQNVEILDDFLQDDKFEDDNSEKTINKIKEKYDNLLDNIFLSRKNDLENLKINEKVDDSKVYLSLQETKDTFRIYYLKQENEIERICKEENLSVNSIYNSDFNKDFSNKKRIIINK